MVTAGEFLRKPSSADRFFREKKFQKVKRSRSSYCTCVNKENYFQPNYELAEKNEAKNQLFSAASAATQPRNTPLIFSKKLMDLETWETTVVNLIAFSCVFVRKILNSSYEKGWANNLIIEGVKMARS